MKVTFPKLNAWQMDCHQDILNGFGTGHHYIIKSGRQRGKNFLINILLLECCLYHPGTIQVLIEPVASQCRRVHKQIVDAIEMTGLLKSSNATTLEIYLINGSSIMFKSAEQRKAIRGMTCTGLCVIDEAAHIDDDIIDIILPIVNVKKCPVLWTSTPMFTEGYFYREWMAVGDMYHHYDWRLDKYDMSAYLSQEQYEAYKESYTPMKFLTEIIGDFCTEQSFVFGDFKKCVLDYGQLADRVPKYGGIDFSNGTGNDSTVIILMNARRQVVFKWDVSKMDPNQQIEILADIINDNPTLVNVLCEMNSMGAVYYSVLKAKLKKKNILNKFYTTNESKRDIIENLILAFQNNNIGICQDAVLIKQLAHYEVQKTKTGYTYNNDNPNIHDDFVMALAVCYKACSEGDISVGFGFSKRKREK